MRILAIILSLVLFYGLNPISMVQAASTPTLTIGNLKEWKLDENKGRIYAVTQDKLLFIETKDLSVAGEVKLDKDITDIQLAQGKLYLASWKTKGILIVDPSSGTVAQTLSTGHVPYQMAIDGDKLFYVEYDQWTNIYEVNLRTGEEKTIELPVYSSYHAPDLVIDPHTHVLYIGDSGMSTNQIEAISTIDDQRLHKSIPSDGFDHDFPLRNVVIDDGYVYYAKQRYRADNLAMVEGDYGESILYAKGDYVFTENGVFHRDQFVKLKGYPKTKHILMDNEKNIYLFSDTDHTVKKVQLELNPTSRTNHQRLAHRLQLGIPLTDWVYDPSQDQIYAISESTNKLLFISMKDLKVVREVIIGSNPTDIDLLHGKIFVALHGATKAAVIETKEGSQAEYFPLHSFPYRIAVDEDQLFYIGEDQHQKLGAYDFSTELAGHLDVVLTRPTNPDFFYEPDLLVNREQHLLYVGESGSSGSTLYAIGTKDHLLKDKHDSFSFPDRRLVSAGPNVYYDYVVWDGRELSRSLYGAGDALFIQYPSILQKDKVVDSLTGKSILLPFPMTLAAMSPQGHVYYYDGEEQTLFAFDSVSELERLKGWMIGDPLGSYLAEDIEGHWAEATIQDFMFADIIKGYIDEEGWVYAKPNHPITRAEFVTILVRAMGLESDQPGKSFSDVDEREWYGDAVRIASSLGIVSGLNDRQFAPNQKIKRDEMATLIVRAFQQTIDFEQGTPKSFRDVPNYWAKPFIDQASGMDILSGYSGSLFKPSAYATRAEAITILSRAFQKEQTELPEDGTLTQVVLNNDRESQQAADAQQWEDLYPINKKYGTGFYQSYSEVNSDQLQALLQEGFEIEVHLQDSLHAIVLEKSNRFATVELEGAHYEIILRKDGSEQTIPQDASGILRLKKDSQTGAWKMYSIQ